MLWSILLAGPVRSQDRDTTASPVDSIATPFRIAETVRGWAVSDSVPAKLPETDLVGLLEEVPASFTYLFARTGWPDGWSPLGLSPNLRPLTYEGIPYTHVFTGRPAFNLVPFSLLEPPRMELQRYARPAAILTRLRPFVSPVPMTEGTYWRGGDGLQSIDVVHAQHRRRPLLGRPGFLNVMGSYSGRATDVIYPGSDLTRGRRVQLRLRYEQESWSAELLNVHNRREIGAHAGVIPPGGNFNGIYREDLAEVDNPNAARRIVRNDLVGTFGARLLGGRSTSIAAFWTSESFRYRDLSDTLLAASDRLGIRARQALLGTHAHTLDVHLEAWSEGTESRRQFSAPTARQAYAFAYVRDSLGVGRLSANLEAGWSQHGEVGAPMGSVTVRAPVGPVRFTADLSTSKASLASAYETGFGDLVGLAGVEPGRGVTGRLEASVRWGQASVAAGGFAHRESDPVDVFSEQGAFIVRRAEGVFRHVGAYLVAGWRREAERGFYAFAAPTALTFLDAGSSSPHARLDRTLPTVFGRARVGARYVIFQGDLDFDVYVEMVSWSSFASRRLDPQTGLLAVPSLEDLTLGASNMLNLVGEFQVRDATLFIVFDNVAAGTQMLPGNMLVPIYPLPAQRFRFGVYWPISG